MAGAVGYVKNNSMFKSFIVKDWQPWMTECVLQHLSGVSVPELRVRFGRTDQHIRNILNTEQAEGIVRKIQAEAIKNTETSTISRIQRIQDKSLAIMEDMLDDESLKETKPFPFWEAARKTMETVGRTSGNIPNPQYSYETPFSAPTVVSFQQNIQNIISSSPDVASRLLSGPTLDISSPIPENVEYLGKLPPAVLGKGDSGISGKGEE